MNNTPLIELHNVTVERDQFPILNDCSWRVNPGEHWVIFGPNGAGKTSLLNVLQGYLWPTGGRVQVFGGTLGDGVDVRGMREQIPVVSESIRRMINESLTGLEVLVTGARGHLNIFAPVSRTEQQQAADLAAQTGVSNLLKKSFGVMSTGERQRILMTRALAPEPRILVLDEPCAGLDLAGREWVVETMNRIAGLAWKPALLLTTHHAEEIADCFSHVLLMKNGKVFATGRLEDVFNKTNLSALFDMPLEVGKNGNRWYARGEER